jgi:hypothetical protein
MFHFLKIMRRSPNLNLQQIQTGRQIYVVERPAWDICQHLLYYTINLYYLMSYFILTGGHFVMLEQNSK